MPEVSEWIYLLKINQQGWQYQCKAKHNISLIDAFYVGNLHIKIQPSFLNSIQEHQISPIALWIDGQTIKANFRVASLQKIYGKV